MTRDPEDCPDCDEDGPCASCEDENFEPPDVDYSMDGQGEVVWESPE